MPKKLREELAEGARRCAEERMADGEDWAGTVAEADETWQRGMDEPDRLAEENEGEGCEPVPESADSEEGEK